MPKPVQVVHNKTSGKIYLQSNTPSFLESKIEVFKSYTGLVDPMQQLGAPAVEEITEADSPNEGFTHQLCLNSILPRIVVATYGEHNLHTQNSNGFGAALIAGGFTVVLSSCDKFDPIFSSKMDNISAKDLCPGDIVVKTGVHAFVYLDNDLCITMNGRGQLFEIASLDSVLAVYDMDRGFLETPNDSIAMFRKNQTHQHWRAPERIMPAMLEFYQITKNPFHCTLPGDRYYGRYEPIANSILDAYKDAKKTGEDTGFVEFTLKKMLKNQYPCRIADPILAELKSDETGYAPGFFSSEVRKNNADTCSAQTQTELIYK